MLSFELATLLSLLFPIVRAEEWGAYAVCQNDNGDGTAGEAQHSASLLYRDKENFRLPLPLSGNTFYDHPSSVVVGDAPITLNVPKYRQTERKLIKTRVGTEVEVLQGDRSSDQLLEMKVEVSGTDKSICHVWLEPKLWVDGSDQPQLKRLADKIAKVTPYLDLYSSAGKAAKAVLLGFSAGKLQKSRHLSMITLNSANGASRTAQLLKNLGSPDLSSDLGARPYVYRKEKEEETFYANTVAKALKTTEDVQKFQVLDFDFFIIRRELSERKVSNKFIGKQLKAETSEAAKTPAAAKTPKAASSEGGKRRTKRYAKRHAPKST